MPYFSFDQINVFGLTIYTWGFFVFLAFMSGLLFVLLMAKKQGLNQDLILNLGLIIFIVGLIGARLAYIIQFPRYYLTDPLEILKINQGGLAMYGGLMGALLVSWIYLKIKKQNFWPVADLFAPAIALSIFIGRWGCFFINDHQGAITSLIWGIEWPDGIIRHPIALYLSLSGLLIFAFLWYFKKRLKRPGQLFLIFLILYAGSVFLLGFLRADPLYFGLSGNQWLSVLLLAAIWSYQNYSRRLH